MAVRFDKAFRSEINRAVKNFNAKITRLEQKGYQVLPRRIYSKNLRGQYGTRRDIRRQLRRMRQFSERGAERLVIANDGRKMTRYEYNLLKKDIAAAKGNIKREIKRLEGYDTPYVGAKNADLKNLEAKYEYLNRDVLDLNYNQLRSVRAIINRAILGKETLQNRRAGFFDRLWKNARFAGISEERLANIEAKLEQLSDTQLQTASFSSQPLLAMTEYYVENSFIEQSPDDMMVRFEVLEENIDDIIESFKKA